MKAPRTNVVRKKRARKFGVGRCRQPHTDASINKRRPKLHPPVEKDERWKRTVVDFGVLSADRHGLNIPFRSPSVQIRRYEGIWLGERVGERILGDGRVGFRSLRDPTRVAGLLKLFGEFGAASLNDDATGEDVHLVGLEFGE